MEDSPTPPPDEVDALTNAPALMGLPTTALPGLAERIEREAAAFYEEHRLTWQSGEALLIARAMRRIAQAVREAEREG